MHDRDHPEYRGDRPGRGHDSHRRGGRNERYGNDLSHGGRDEALSSREGGHGDWLAHGHRAAGDRHPREGYDLYDSREGYGDTGRDYSYQDSWSGVGAVPGQRRFDRHSEARDGYGRDHDQGRSGSGQAGSRGGDPYGWRQGGDRGGHGDERWHQQDARRSQGWGGYGPAPRGRSPKGYMRSDERIREDICERLMDASAIDAGDVSVDVEQGTVRLEGSVQSRWMKHRIEDIADGCSGVRDVSNQITVASRPSSGEPDAQEAAQPAQRGRSNQAAQAGSSGPAGEASSAASQGRDQRSSRSAAGKR